MFGFQKGMAGATLVLNPVRLALLEKTLWPDEQYQQQNHLASMFKNNRLFG